MNCTSLFCMVQGVGYTVHYHCERVIGPKLQWMHYHPTRAAFMSWPDVILISPAIMSVYCSGCSFYKYSDVSYFLIEMICILTRYIKLCHHFRCKDMLFYRSIILYMYISGRKGRLLMNCISIQKNSITSRYSFEKNLVVFDTN